MTLFSKPKRKFWLDSSLGRQVKMEIPDKLVGPAPRFPEEMKDNLDAYQRGELTPKDTTRL
jgi:hypothetical protein